MDDKEFLDGANRNAIEAERRQLWREVFVAAITSRDQWDDADAENLATAAVYRFDQFCLDKPEDEA